MREVFVENQFLHRAKRAMHRCVANPQVGDGGTRKEHTDSHPLDCVIGVWPPRGVEVGILPGER